MARLFIALSFVAFVCGNSVLALTIEDKVADEAMIVTAIPPHNESITTPVPGEFPIVNCPGFDFDSFKCMFGGAEGLKFDFDTFKRTAQHFGFKIKTCYEAAAFFGSIAFNTNNLKSYAAYCSRNSTDDVECPAFYDKPCPWNCDIQPAAGQRYYPRGTMMLAFPCNYYAMSNALGFPYVFENPDLLQESAYKAWISGQYVWTQKENSSHPLLGTSCQEFAQDKNFGKCLQRYNNWECSTTEGMRDQKLRLDAIERAGQCLNIDIDRSTLECDTDPVPEQDKCDASGPDSTSQTTEVTFDGNDQTKGEENESDNDKEDKESDNDGEDKESSNDSENEQALKSGVSRSSDFKVVVAFFLVTLGISYF